MATSPATLVYTPRREQRRIVRADRDDVRCGRRETSSSEPKTASPTTAYTPLPPTASNGRIHTLQRSRLAACVKTQRRRHGQRNKHATGDQQRHGRNGGLHEWHALGIHAGYTMPGAAAISDPTCKTCAVSKTGMPTKRKSRNSAISRRKITTTSGNAAALTPDSSSVRVEHEGSEPQDLVRGPPHPPVGQKEDPHQEKGVERVHFRDRGLQAT